MFAQLQCRYNLIFRKNKYLSLSRKKKSSIYTNTEKAREGSSMKRKNMHFIPPEAPAAAAIYRERERLEDAQEKCTSHERRPRASSRFWRESVTQHNRLSLFRLSRDSSLLPFATDTFSNCGDTCFEMLYYTKIF